MNTSQAAIDELVDEFAFLDDWEARYRHVIELGANLDPITDEERAARNKIAGCVSQVWLVTEQDGAPDTRLTFRGDSDAHIVRGLVAVLIRIYSGRTPAEILAVDAEETLSRLGFREHLSPQRSNGLASMVARIRAEASAAQGEAANP